VDFEDRGVLKSHIRDHLLARTGPNTLHIAGLSGIGKSRTVFEACRDDEELRGVFYVPTFPAFTRELQRYLEAPGRVAMVVIDEMPLNRLDGFIGQFEEFTDRLRFVTIGPAPRDGSRRSSYPNLLLLSEPRTDAGVVQVVRGAGHGLPDLVLESIAKISAHDLRLALLLVRATRQMPEYREVPIVDVEDIWQRVMSLFRAEIGDVERFRDHYEVLSSCIDVGREGEFRPELEFLAQYHRLAALDLDRSITMALRCGLGVETPYFFEPGPRALAAQLFQHRGWPALRPTLHDFLRAMPTERLRRRFIERCQECAGEVRREAEHSLGLFFQRDLGDGDLLRLADRDRSRVFQAWAELDPQNGIRWLRRAVSRARHEDLASLDGRPDGSGGWRGRRQVVWLCEHLACFAEHFFDCEEILFRLAQVETEPSIANNSVETWRAMFRPVLSNTEVAFSSRLDLLLGRLRRATAEELPLVLSGAMGILALRIGRVEPPRVVGGRIVPAEWRPSSHQERVRSQKGVTQKGALVRISELAEAKQRG